MKISAALLARAALWSGMVAVGLGSSAASATGAAASDESAWPEVTQSARPWIRWWWPGSAVEPAELTRHLEEFARAGIGGVEITPIYGARGAEARYIDYLSPRWVEMLAHTAREARRLGLGVDMATGTGWPFGGPEVQETDAASSPQFADGRLLGKPTEMKVKRAAPGGEGLVLDPYSAPAMNRYLERFTKALAPLPRGAIRSQFHDSFEYFNASWSSALPEYFLAHGYDLRDYAAEFTGAKPFDRDLLGRVKGDYRRALASLHLDYLGAWTRWAHARGFRARNQAHGSPGRLLDLYGASDIPETESFGATVLPIPGLRQDANDIRDDPDPPINLIGRFASSAAHVQGRELVSSETLTWLRENFRESPSQAKPQLDRLFIAGINHVFYHGTTYSPADAPWPGWFFYAATQLNPSNPLWQDFSAMHAYVARVQSLLQAGRPDNDLLFYWPEADEQDDPEGFMRQHGMHENDWLVKSPAGRRALHLIESGYSLDFISDAQLQSLQVKGGTLVAPGGRYRLLLVPDTRRMPVETLAALASLSEAGARLRIEGLPEDVPGFGKLEERRAKLHKLLSSAALRRAAAVPPDEKALPQVTREPMAALGLWFTRRARADGRDYFLVNPTAKAFEGWVTLDTAAGMATLMDPLTEATGATPVKADGTGRARVYLQLPSGGSIFVRTWAMNSRAPARRDWVYLQPMGAPEEVTGDWMVTFDRGGPELPAAAKLQALGSWTAFPDPRAARFSGTVTYRIELGLRGQRASDWLLDLGDVRETARVSVNGRRIGTLWSLPAKIRLPGALREYDVLEIEVTNLPANRVRDLDLRRVDWKIMKDINLASLRYRALDAATWEPQPSGLLGPVRLVPLRVFTPPDP